MGGQTDDKMDQKQIETEWDSLTCSMQYEMIGPEKHRQIMIQARAQRRI